ncbi:AAA family ATPase [Paenibacillus sp. KN14-4R]|uniref:AAA family ATPase n=1 Tax=Paenibacillus sp. KN14-4R TaxID=3445773 RepID=UPI003FA0B87B
MAIFSEEIPNILKHIKSNLEGCIHGKPAEINLLLTALLAKGHVLIEDVPGTGKTVFVKALAKSIEGQFRRIQCNPDLLPTDVTGVSIYHPKEEQFIFRPGPLFTNLLLVDEINRATTKTQSALLEAMEEKVVTMDGEGHALPEPFMMLATQNPIDFEGTYSLPEAQLDRFMFKLSLGYPDQATEHKMILSQEESHPLERLAAVADIQQIQAIQEHVHKVHLDESVAAYIVDITRATRVHPSVYLGASPRATLAFVHAAKAFALINGRSFVLPDDVKYLAPYILSHRILIHSGARMEGANVNSVLQSILEQVKVPVRLEK